MTAAATRRPSSTTARSPARRETFTYAELLDRVATFAGALASLGVEKGDRVVIYMPMVPEAVVAMLACARLGAVHSVVFGGFAPAELAARIEDAKPVVIVSASCGIEPSRVVEYKPMLDAALDRSSHKPESVIVLQREQCRAAVGERDTDWEELDWDELVADAEPAGCVDVEATDPLYVLYTSGTTGRPKGIVRDNGGHAVALRWSMEQRLRHRARATCGSRHPTSGGSSGTPTSSTRRCSPARRPFSTRASRSAPPTRAPSGGSSATTA